MKLLSIDVGIKNLAFCLMDYDKINNKTTILKWDSINISQQQFYTCTHINSCIPCNKPAKYYNNNHYFCLKHAKKQKLLIPTVEQTPSFINKRTITQLYELADKYNIHLKESSKKLKKTELISIIHSYFVNNYFKILENINASDINLFDIGKNIKFYFDTIFSSEIVIEHVIIENQIGPIANRMKTIQGMLVQYFIMSPIIVDNIEFISASNKLKCLNESSTIKTNYADRKKKGIAKCLEIITSNSHLNEFISFYNSHKKKDDLSDCFLQGIWYITNKL
jgi:hypothetical protein